MKVSQENLVCHLENLFASRFNRIIFSGNSWSTVSINAKNEIFLLMTYLMFLKIIFYGKIMMLMSMSWVLFFVAFNNRDEIDEKY